MRTASLVVILISGLIVVAMLAGVWPTGGGASHGRDVVTACRADPEPVDRLIAVARDSGVMVGRVREAAGGGVRIDVHEDAWARLDRDSKLTLGLTVFCTTAGRDGRGTVDIRSSRDSALLGRVVDGYWRD